MKPTNRHISRAALRGRQLDGPRRVPSGFVLVETADPELVKLEQLALEDGAEDDKLWLERHLRR